MIRTQPDWKHRALHLGALWAFAIGKPLLDSINESGFFLLPRAAAPVDIVLLAVLVLFAVPALLLGIEQLAGLASPRLRDGVHLAIVAFLLAVLIVQILGSLGLREPRWAILASLALAAAGTYAYARTRFVPTTLDVLSPAPVLFLVLYLFFSPSIGLWLPGSEPDAAEVTAASDPPVVFVLLDELPTDSLFDSSGRIDASRYPNFTELAERSTFYENATTVADQTERAIPAIVSGKRQDSERARTAMPVARTHPETIFTLLGDAYEIEATETVTQLCPRDICERTIRDPFAERFGRLAADLAAYTPAAVLPRRVHDRVFGMGSEISPLAPTTPTEEFGLLVDGIDAQPATLDFLHASNLPHKPWTMVPSLRTYMDPAEIDDGIGHENVGEAPQVEIDDRKRHLLELGAADGLVGRLMDHLDELGAWEETMFVLVADHGISFRPNTGRRRAADPNLDQLAFVPLFLKFPGQERGGTDSTPVQTIDIVPTIAQELGVQIPWEVDGVPVSERPAAVGDEQIDVVNYRGAIVSQSLATLLKRRQRFAEQQNKIFRTGRGWNALIESGPGSELIGTRPPESIPESEAEADLILSGDRDDPDSVDAVVAGRLRGLEPGRPIAIEVNGRIAATTASVAGNEGVRYEAVLPPRVYERSVDELRVLLVRPGGGFELLGSA